MTYSEKPTYEIIDWDTHFETSETKKYQRLGWVPIPNKHDGFGYRSLISQPDGFILYAAWVLILQVASKKKKPRGLLTDDSGSPLTPMHLAMKTGAPCSAFEKALPVLVQIGWVKVVSGNLPEQQKIAGESPGTTVTNRIEQNSIEKKETTLLCDPKETTTTIPVKKRKKRKYEEHPEFNSWYAVYPKKDGRDAAAKEYIEALGRGATVELLLEAAQAYAASRADKDPTYTKAPKNWLSGGHWKDIVPVEAGGPGAPPLAEPTEEEMRRLFPEWKCHQ